MSRKPITIAKISRPRLFGVVPRRHLFRQLDDCLHRSLVWIHAPPGAGKTALVASYLESRRIANLWYQLDSGDSDVSTLFYYLGLASPRRKVALPVLTPEYLPDIERFARRFFRELYARMGPRSVIVFDNYQEVPPASVFHSVIRYALAELPEEICVIALSRAEPPPELAHVQAGGMLALMDWPQLKLTLEETRAIACAEAIGDNLVAALHERCGGWAAGLRLMVERLRRKGVSDGDFEAATREAVFNYFAGQIFQTATPRNQQILLKTALLPRVTVRLAEAISGDPEAGRLLEFLYRRHLFTDRRLSAPSVGESTTNSRSSVREPVFEYHALFREFLIDIVRDTFSAEARAQLAQRAAALLEQEGTPDAAIVLYREAGDWEAVTALVRRAAPALLAQGRWQTLTEWVGHIPPAWLEESPWLLYWLGRARIAVDQPRARQYLERAFALFQESSDASGQIVAIAAIVWSHYLEAFSTENMDRWIEPLERLLGENQVFQSAEVEVAAYSALLLVAMWIKPSHPMLQKSALRLIDLMNAPVGINEKISAAICLLQYFDLSGQFALGSRVIGQVDPLTRAPELMPIARVTWQVNCGYHRYILGEHDSALPILQEAIGRAQHEGLIQSELYGWAFHAYVHIVRWESAEARQALLAQEKLLHPAWLVGNAQYQLGKSMQCQLLGEKHDAARYADACIATARKTVAPFFFIVWGSIVASAYAEAGDYSKALITVEQVRQASEGTCFQCYEGLLALNEAYVAYLQERPDACRRRLEEALAWARSRDLPYFFRWMVVGMPILFAHALRAGIETDYVTALVRTWRVRPPSEDVEGWPWRLRIVTLGRFGILKDEQPLEFGRKAPARLLEMLKLITARGGHDVASDWIMQAMWPEAEGDAAEQAFANALYRMRRLLGHEEALLLIDRKVSLNRSLCALDLWEFERHCRRIDRTYSRPSAESSQGLEADAVKLMDLYRGHFLAQESLPGAVVTRERLRSLFARYVSMLGQRLEELAEWQNAAQLYSRAVEVDSLAEHFYQRLMVCYRELGQKSEGVETYRRCREMLSIVLGLTPSAKTQEVYESLRGG